MSNAISQIQELSAQLHNEAYIYLQVQKPEEE